MLEVIVVAGAVGGHEVLEAGAEASCCFSLVGMVRWFFLADVCPLFDDCAGFICFSFIFD